MTQIDNIQLRRNTAALAAASNPTLNEGEPGFETDTGKFKIGDGVTAWNALEYAGQTGIVENVESLTELRNIGQYNPVWNSADIESITGLTGDNKWFGGVLAPNGKIYCVPRSSTSVLIIDPETNTAETTSITGLTGNAKWYGGVLAPNGKIYCVPYN